MVTAQCVSEEITEKATYLKKSTEKANYNPPAFLLSPMKRKPMKFTTTRSQLSSHNDLLPGIGELTDTPQTRKCQSDRSKRTTH